MSKTGEIPYSWPQIEEQIKEAILAQASILEAFGPSGDLVADYLGLDREAFRGNTVEDVRDVDIKRHAIHYHAKVAYEYAYQIGECSDPGSHSSTWHDVDGLLQGFPETDAAGEPSPFCRLNDFPLRRVLETFYARFALFEELALLDGSRPSIRELALMSNMTVPAVRTSLSKEGFKLEKTNAVTRSNQEEASFRLNDNDAKMWLSRRRGFIPQRINTDNGQAKQIIDQVLADRDIPFPLALTRIMAVCSLQEAQVAEQAKLDPLWLSNLIAGEHVTPDLSALQAIALVLDVPEPDFVGAGIRHILTKDQG